MKCGKCGMPIVESGMDRCFCISAKRDIGTDHPGIVHIRDNIYKFNNADDIGRYDDEEEDEYVFMLHDGFRLLRLGEMTLEGDEYLNLSHTTREGHCIWSKITPGNVYTDEFVPVRRKI